MTEQQLPLPDYDELPMTSLQHRIRSLSEGDLGVLLEHERAHGNRTPIIELLRTRMGDLERGASPSSGSQTEHPETAEHKRAGSPVAPGGPRGTGRPAAQGTVGNTGKGMDHSE